MYQYYYTIIVIFVSKLTDQIECLMQYEHITQ